MIYCIIIYYLYIEIIIYLYIHMGIVHSIAFSIFLQWCFIPHAEVQTFRFEWGGVGGGGD